MAITIGGNQDPFWVIVQTEEEVKQKLHNLPFLMIPENQSQQILSTFPKRPSFALELRSSDL